MPTHCVRHMMHALCCLSVCANRVSGGKQGARRSLTKVNSSDPYSLVLQGQASDVPQQCSLWETQQTTVRSVSTGRVRIAKPLVKRQPQKRVL
jgi:hypothetical protein